MKRLRNWVKKYFRDPDQIYLENSVDLADLERRMKILERRKRPFYGQYNQL